MLPDFLADAPESALPAWRVALYISAGAILLLGVLVVPVMLGARRPRFAKHRRRWWRRGQARPVELVVPAPLPPDPTLVIRPLPLAIESRRNLPAEPWWAGRHSHNAYADRYRPEEVSR